ncbi:uncharacterized protein MKK02DRAFT_18641 [Dioszegia hungarica]|uniref:S-adenosyl-L-methionine-dependent methyltransferase n=1 Tax=Dioszegia hungarica TaxID=4972 RepID=A0AA38H398_9TREE|nr:uncharacterized protein MKK02DRAFT_18641 [Dioszegia hungarica]KAI9633278.1 hypothetical protein MKK02DRAFT_18641 [Dioszegia hungarica]
MSTSIPSGTSRWPVSPLPPRHTSWPYTPSDFRRSDESPDTNFYGPARFVTHIDDNAIATLRSYYGEVLPKQGRVLDLCSSWISHFPPELEAAAKTRGERGGLEVIGMGMNQAELAANPILSSSHLVDLNADPTLPSPVTDLDATVCVVSIDYLTQPLTVLQGILAASKPGATVHLILSNRCFPTKAVGRWLRISEEERVKMVGDYLHFSGWKEIEVVTLVAPGSGRTWIGGGSDPLWVVRGRKGEA